MAKVEITPSHRMDCIQEYYFSKKNREIAELRKAGRDIISLGIGSPDMPPRTGRNRSLGKGGTASRRTRLSALQR